MLSVPPEVKTISSGSTPSTSATCSCAASNAAPERRPPLW